MVGLNETVGFGGRSSSCDSPRPPLYTRFPPDARVGSVGFKAVGVPVGVGFALSSLDFLDPDRGVMLSLRKEPTGVVRSSLWGPLGVVS